MTPRQKKILEFIGDQEKKKSEIVENFPGWYFHNSAKYIGEMLTRLVNSNHLIRTRIGYYKKGSAIAEPDKNQLNLF